MWTGLVKERVLYRRRTLSWLLKCGQDVMKQPGEAFWQEGLWERRVLYERQERTAGEDFRVFSDQNVEATCDVAW